MFFEMTKLKQQYGRRIVSFRAYRFTRGYFGRPQYPTEIATT